MKRGYLEAESGLRRPYIEALLYFPLVGDQPMRTQFLVDTGADRTSLSPAEGVRLRRRYGLNLLSLPQGTPSRGVGGQMGTRIIEATVTMEVAPHSIVVMLPPP